ncbi:MAG: hypothetical protein MUC50_16910, partial [Myxococcota bacterium]|nr:hypothetical protein [Myxococcota bacterium]
MKALTRRIFVVGFCVFGMMGCETEDPLEGDDQIDLTERGTASMCTVVNENSTATLSCPSGQVIESITFASYGTPTGSCPSFATSACHASSSKSNVESRCLN